ncbi:hypothetical protein AVEN_204386-1 [Araneus ventricosus]|uniref:Uncharacterized protein n=1 Tax=Araneus ventricosus TaxID=182803 RepID=A0A4Y2KD28_ARAVE|nr:hypothetical protein AVEN_204386-1 [Araneus ventricosus]
MDNTQHFYLQPTSIQSNSNKNQTSHHSIQQTTKNSNLPWSTSSTTTTATDIIQINLAKSKVATAHLAKVASEININHFLGQEPRVKEGKIAGVPRKWHQLLSSNNKTGSISLPSTNIPMFISSTTNLTAIKIQTITGPVNLISAYSSPYVEVQETDQDLLTKIGPEQALIGEDTNAPSTLLGYANNNPRGNIMEDLISGQPSLAKREKLRDNLPASACKGMARTKASQRSLNG